MIFMATPSKTQLLTNVYTLLKRRYKSKADRNASRLSVLKSVIYGICHEDTTREQANQALSRFNDEFFDWNEIRVSSVEEIQESLAGIPDPELKAQRIRKFLRQLFNRTYGFNLDALTKKPLKEALKVLRTYEAFSSDFVTATVIQQGLGGHAIPIDRSARRALERLGVSEPELPALRAVLERAIPKNRGAEFADLLEDLADDTCVAGVPDCPHCELRKICPFAAARKHEPKPAAAGRGGAARANKVSAQTAKPKSKAKAKGPTSAAATRPIRKKPPAKTAKVSPRHPKSPRGKHGHGK
jgi:endonuclease-3